MKRVSKWKVSIKSFPSELRGILWKDYKSQRMENTRRTRASESTKQGTYELTETEVARTGPTWVLYIIIAIIERQVLYISIIAIGLVS